MSAEEYAAWFRSADKDNSGALSYLELQAALVSKGYDEAKVQKMFRVMDISQDGSVSLDEYLKTMGVEPKEHHGASALKRICWSFDKDGSGTIDKSELTEVFESMGSHITPEQVDRMMKSFDTDGDGQVDYNELCHKLFGKTCD